MSAITLIYGSVYGSAHYVATELARVLGERGCEVALHEQPEPRHLHLDRPLLVVTSTTGDGELPSRLQPLLQQLQRQAPDLRGLRFALVALGDSSYQHYCGGGRALAAALERCGATAIAPSLELDACHCLNPEDEALPWALQLLEENP